MFPWFRSQDHIILASYPKSGNTWLRFILSHLYSVGNVEVSFETIEQLIPGVVKPWKRLFIKQMLDPPVFKSHSHYVESNSHCRNIYIVRDPRDVYLFLSSFSGWSHGSKPFSMVYD